MTRKTVAIFLLLGVLLFAFPYLNAILMSQEPAVEASEEIGSGEALTAPEKTISVTTGMRSIHDTWFQFYEKGRPISDIIALVFLLGLIFALDETRKIFFDSIRSRSLRKMDLQNSNLKAISMEIEKQPGTQLSRLLNALLSSYHTMESVEGIIGEVNLYIQHLQDQFNSFRTRIDFLSDSAGALGLLGTVWGIFVTFEVENWTQDTVLKGMGLALVTTFIGIIVSLILNLISTEVFNYFNRRNDRLQMKSKELKVNIFEHHVQRNFGPGGQPAGQEQTPEVGS